MSNAISMYDRINASGPEYAQIKLFSGFVIQNEISIEYFTNTISARFCLILEDAKALHAALGKHIANIAGEGPTDAA